MTNPNDAVGTNAAYGGRTSANAFNDDLAAYTTGIVSGWACAPNSGMTVSLGGDGTARDVAIAEDNAGNKTTINNISGSPIDVTLDAAPASNSRIDLVVAYVDNPPQGDNSTADNPGACGIINVTGTAGATPIAPNDSDIRTAITGDGASGTTAYYVILAQITVTSGTTTITSGDIEAGQIAQSNLGISGSKIIEADNIDFNTFAGYQMAALGGSSKKSIGSTWTTYYTHTITATEEGLYFVELYFSSDVAGSTEFRSNARVQVNGTNQFSVGAWSINNWAGNSFTEGNRSRVLWLKTNDIVTAQGQNEHWTGNLTVSVNLKKIY